MGFRGSRVQIPPSRLGPRGRRGGLVVTACLAPSLAALATCRSNPPPCRLSEDQALQRVSLWGFFLRLRLISRSCPDSPAEATTMTLITPPRGHERARDRALRAWRARHHYQTQNRRDRE